MIRLTVTGPPSSQLLLRVVNLFAQRGLTPRALSARCGGDAMTIVVDAGLADDAAAILVEKLRSLVEADEVSVSVPESCPG